MTDTKNFDSKVTGTKAETVTMPLAEIKAETKTDDAPDTSDDVFGVDPVTKDMHADEFYAYLLKKYAGDRSQIREFLRTLGSEYACGFMHNAFFEKSFSSMTASEQLDFCSKLEKLSLSWHTVDYIKTPRTAAEFMQDPGLRESYSNAIVIVKYYEQYGARFWQNKWAKEMRGTIIFVNPETLAVTCATKLERGAEAVTGMVSKMNLETQDVKPGKIKILDEEQKDTCIRLCAGKPIDMHLTSKGDGSLLVITSYTGMFMKIMLPVVELFGSDYTRLWAAQSLTQSSGKRLLVPATQGTLMEAGFMAPYMVTSMLSGSGICSRDDLDILDKKGLSYVDVWGIHGSHWIDRFLGFTFFDELSQIQTFCFEAICKDRCGLFGDHPHVELACSYTRDRLIFLGTCICEKRFYIPHSLYGTLSRIPFEEPLWWKISHAEQVDQMIDDIGQMILNKMSKKDYLTKYSPANRGFDVDSKSQIDQAIIDYEGWVAMKIATLKVTDPDHLTVIKTLSVPLTIYSKIKTEAYYRSHKFRMENIPYLTELSKTAGDIFPLSRKIAGVCASGAVTERLTVIGQQTMRLLDFKDPDNKIMPLLRAAFKATLDAAALGGPTAKLPKDPLVGFEKRPFDVQCKMALNFRGFDFGELLVPIYLDVFPEIDPMTPDLKGICSGLTMTLQPWSKDYADRIKDLIPSSPAVQGLITACIGTSVV